MGSGTNGNERRYCQLEAEVMIEIGRLESGMVKWGIGLVISNIIASITVAYGTQRIMKT